MGSEGFYMDEIKWKLGVDAGGTRTRALLRDVKSGREGRGYGGVGNPRVVGVEGVAQSISEAIEGAVVEAGCGWADIGSACLGIAGVGRTPLNADELLLLKSRLALPCLVTVMSDLEIAHAGVFRGAVGVLVVMGTGSSVLARSESGVNYQIGGWGWAVDDVGGATDIGRRAVRELMNGVDRGEALGILGRCVLSEVGEENINQLVGWLYRDGKIRGRFAELAPVVSGAMAEGCERAKAVVEDSFRELVDKIEWSVRQAEMERDFSIVILGGMVESKEFRWVIETLIGQRFPEASIRFSEKGYWEGIALEGALLSG